MRELSLFSGAGGGLLGTRLLGWQHCGYVESNNYCQQIIAARIKDGYLEPAPIFGDIQAFIDNGYADAYQGMVDVITAGFPCQPFSLAGKQAGGEDPRNRWPQTIEVIRRVRPGFALLENVPGLLANQYIRTIFRNLAESGYQCRWRILSAAEMGAPHKRDRVWIVAYSQSKQGDGPEPETGIDCEQPQCKSGNGYEQDVRAVFYTNHQCQRRKRSGEEKIPWEQTLPWGKSLGGFEDIEKRSDIPGPLVCGMDDGLAHRLDRIKALGNGQIPIVAAVAWLLLTEEFNHE